MDDSRPRDITIPPRDGYFPVDTSRAVPTDSTPVNAPLAPPSVALPQPIVGFPQQQMQPEFNPQVIAVESQPVVVPIEPLDESVFASAPVVPAVSEPVTPVIVESPSFEPIVPFADDMSEVADLMPVAESVIETVPESIDTPEFVPEPVAEQPAFSLPPPPPPPVFELPVTPALTEEVVAEPIEAARPEPAPLENAIENIDPIVIPASSLGSTVRSMDFITPAPAPVVALPPFETAAPEPIQPPAPSTLERTFTRPPEPASRPVAVNPVAGYFQSIAGGTSAIPTAATTNAPSWLSRFKKPIIIAGVSLLLIGIGVYATTTLIANNNARQAVQTEDTPEPVTEAPAVIPTEEEKPAEEELPAIVPAPEVEGVVQPTTPTVIPAVANTSANDAEIAKQPRKISIPTLGISASIENIGLTPSGAIGAPSSIWNAGWYTASAQPGTDGAVFIDGHASESRNGIFGDLDKARVGETITVLRNDGKEISYWIAKISVVDRRHVDVAQTLKPYGNAKRGLNIMSCIGTWVESEKTLTHRVLVYAIER